MMAHALAPGVRPRLQRAAGIARRIASSSEQLDLAAVAAVSVAALLLGLADAPQLVRLPIGLVAVLLLPGYSLSMALFPPGRLDAVERWALAFSLSLGTIVIGAPILSFAGVPLEQSAILAAVSAVTLGATALAALRRRRQPRPVSAEALDPAAVEPGGIRIRRVVAVTGAAALLAVYVGVSLADRPVPVTEFYLLGPGGTVDSLPARAAPGSTLKVGVGIANAANPAEPYRIVAEVGTNRLAELGPLSVEPGGSWTGELVMTVPELGADRAIRIQLFKGAATVPYRSLRLFVEAPLPT